MPRGENPNSQKALAENRAKTQFRGETAVKAQRKAAALQRKLKSFRELDTENTMDDERMEMLDALKLKAKRGNLHAFEIYRDTMGMRPKDAEEQTEYEDDGFTDAIKRSAKDVWK